MNLYLHKDAANDQLYIGVARDSSLDLSARETIQVNDNIAIDLDENGRLVGIDISNATKVLGEEAFSLPLEGDEIIGVAEAAELCNVNKPNFIRDFVNRPGFPQPITQLASGRLWYRSQLREYLESRPDTTALPIEPPPTERASVYEYLRFLMATDELAFRRNALTYFARVTRGTGRTPTIEKITSESIDEDIRLTGVAQSGDVELYVNAAWELLQKYSKALESYISGVVPERSDLQPEKIAKDVWIEALRRIQLGEFSRETGTSFTRWILQLADMLLGANGIEVPKSPEPMHRDPLEEAASITRYQQALRERRTAEERMRSELLVLGYLSELSEEELEFAMPDSGGVQSLAGARRALDRRLKQIRRELSF